jgi:hypothetical protein
MSLLSFCCFCWSQVVQHRVRDGALLRLIDKWLNAGVMECGEISYPEAGSPRGGVISPVLAGRRSDVIAPEQEPRR